ncbi:MAG: hypothetical protein ABJZ80_09625 [Gilvibacter sp.]
MILVASFSSIHWGILFFATIGNWICFIGYYAIKRNELVLYKNLGFNTISLLLYSAVFMVIAAFPIGLVLLGLKALLWPT